MIDVPIFAVVIGGIVVVVVCLCCFMCCCICTIKYMCYKCEERKEEKREREAARERDLKKRRARNAENQRRELELKQAQAIAQSMRVTEQYARNVSPGWREYSSWEQQPYNSPPRYEEAIQPKLYPGDLEFEEIINLKHYK